MLSHRQARSSFPHLWVLVLLFVSIALVGCNTRGITLPYVAHISEISPELPGLTIRATAGGGGELEITNHTGAELTLLDVGDVPYVRLARDGVYELVGEQWVKTSETPVYYCHDPRLTYHGPEPASQSTQVVKRWVIHGYAGAKKFVVTGTTEYLPRGLFKPF
jgi:hypothetical protein